MHPKLARNQLLESRACALRGSPTRSEEALWRVLSAGKLGVSARRQVVLGNFIADFAVPARRLVIEVDGGSHAGRAAADARRDRGLARLGWRVLRLDAELVLSSPEEALARVRAALAG
ncbi:MAG: DUF559 domain-containing protein [Polyangiaceae bacterium]|nr:DUF559 domain-containing protein [Polyangiaceae bacterium]MCL4755479.1 DUF559 domain-containing protein [Myxococcales bacterium]